MSPQETLRGQNHCDSRHGLQVYPNVLTDTVLTAPDQAWVADLTYIHLRSAFVYLACILDAFSRRCVGWHLSRDMTTQLTLAALRLAIAQRHPQPGLIHHSDRGVQYASHDYVEQLEQIGVQISMSSVSNLYDNNLECWDERFWTKPLLIWLLSLMFCKEDTTRFRFSVKG